MPTHYLLNNQHVATSAYPPPHSDIQQSHVSWLFICPTCGDPWGRIYTEGFEWCPERRGCVKHPWLDPIGGSFLPSWSVPLDQFPHPVLLREFRMRFDHYTRTNNHGSPSPN